MFPSIWGETPSTAWWPPLTRGFFDNEESRATRCLNTDIRETESSYELDVELPGFQKDQVSIELDSGYLTIQAETPPMETKDASKDTTYLRRERFLGHCTRRFYVGTSIKPEDIEARFRDGLLHLAVPKSNKTQTQETHAISIQD